tara:strand:- start:132 stop:506 length:375 start_codon:yes stop_codon:yes gene_type:complete
MARLFELSKEQDLVNKINSQVEFSYSLIPTEELERYVVGYDNLWTGKNPSLNCQNVWSIVEEAVNGPKFILGHVFGTWLDKDTGKYYIDISTTYDSLEWALRMAKQRNELAIYDRVLGIVIEVE